MKILLVNPPWERCGVHQYGKNLFACLRPSERHWFEICHPQMPSDLHRTELEFKPDLFMFNYHPGIAGSQWYLHYAQSRKSIGLYHEGSLNPQAFRAQLFSDPTIGPVANVHPIGRPLPVYLEPCTPFEPREAPWIGLNGFCGAWAECAFKWIAESFSQCVLRVQLPVSDHCDPNGDRASEAGKRVREFALLHGFGVNVCYDFLPLPKLLEWLQANDLNCYIRDLPTAWQGVSSAPDCALAVRKPIAVNRCVAFRHLHRLQPSVCVEENSLRTIMHNGLKPLKPLYDDWTPERIRAQVEKVLESCL